MTSTNYNQEAYPLNKSDIHVMAVATARDQPDLLVGKFFLSDDYQGFKTRLTIILKDDYYSLLEFRATVSFKDGDITTNREMKIGLSNMNTSSVTCQRMDRASTVPQAVRDLFRDEETYNASLESAEIWSVDADYTAEPILASNVYTKVDSACFGSQASQVEALRALFKDGKRLRFWVCATILADHVQALTRKFSEESERDPLSLWYPSHPEKVFIQVGDYPAADERPNPTLKAKPTFNSRNEYVTVLGFSTIAEHEHTKSMQEIVNADKLDLRVMSIHDAGNRRYLGFVAKPEGSQMSLKTGDVITLNFDEDDDRDDDWPGFVIDPIPFGAMNDVSIIFTRPWDKENRVFREDCGTFHVIDSTKVHNETRARQALMNEPATKVSIRVKISDKDHKRQINSLRLLQESDHRDTWELFLGNSLSQLPTKDMFRSVDATEEQIKQVFTTGRFNEKQLEAVDICRKATCGNAYIQGPPGSGKSHFLVWLGMPLLLFDSKIPRRQGTNRHQILLTAAVNEPVDDMARKLADAAEQLAPERHLVVVRVHSITSEVEIVNKPAKQQQGKPANAREDLIQEGSEDALLTEMLAAHIVKNMYTEATARPFGVSDKRVKQYGLSLGNWMLRFAGIIPDPVFSDASACANFVTLYGTFRMDPDMDKDAKMDLRKETKALRNKVLKRADGVVTTLSNAADPAIRENIRPDFIGVDEAAKATEPNIWHVLVGYDPHGTVHIGDQRQTRPVVLSAPNKDGTGNGLAAQLGMSQFSRMISNGMETVMFEVQHRMHPDIGEMVSKCFFEGRLKHAPASDNMALSNHFIKLTGEHYGIRSALVFHNVMRGTVMKDSTSSSYNIPNVVHATNILFELLKAGTLPSQIKIVCPYAAQCKMYAVAITRIQELNPGKDLRGISIQTIDKAQGLERQVVIFDLTVLDRFGFIDSGRLLVGLSRAQCGMHVIYSQYAIDQAPKNAVRVIADVHRYAKKQKLVYTPVHATSNAFIGLDNIPVTRGHAPLVQASGNVDEYGFEIVEGVTAETSQQAGSADLTLGGATTSAKW